MTGGAVLLVAGLAGPAQAGAAASRTAPAGERVVRVAASATVGAPDPSAPASGQAVPRTHLVQGPDRTSPPRRTAGSRPRSSSDPVPMPPWNNDLHPAFGLALPSTNTGIIATQTVNLRGIP